MNERVAKAGNQVKDAFNKLIEAWKNQEAERKKKIRIIAIIVLAAVLAIAIGFNIYGKRYIVLYDGMSSDEVVRASSALQAEGLSFKRNDKGQLTVPAKSENQAIMVLAAASLPSSRLTYDTFEKANGLMVSETQRSQMALYQTQDRLQDTLRGTPAIADAVVEINPPESSSKVWDVNSRAGSASIKLYLQKGYVLSADQINGVRYYVSSAVGIDPLDITITDGDLNPLALQGNESSTANNDLLSKMQERQKIENLLKDEFHAGAATIMAMYYDDPSRYDFYANVVLDYSEVVKEIKEYFPLDGTDRGVLDLEEYRALWGVGQYVAGIAGEDWNTDIPTYADYDGDDEIDSVDVEWARDYAVSYILEQHSKDGPDLVSAGMSVVVRDTLTQADILMYREAISAATGIPAANIFVGAKELEAEPDRPDSILPWVSDSVLFILIGVFVGLIILLILVLILRSKAKKKRSAEAEAAALAALEEQERIQMEIEQRKLQLKNAAVADTQNDAIVNEVRDFAKSNPDITANLLRNWLRENE